MGDNVHWSIETRELRVGRLAELNDPFEFVPGITGLRDDAPKDYVREQLWKTQADLNSALGLLSFAASCREPTLWSHYAEAPVTADRKFEDVVKSAQDAAVLVLVY